jgi:hypothetical protein
MMKRDGKIRANSTESQRNPIDVLVLDYEVPQELANRMVGRNHAETERNIRRFIGYIAFVVEEHKALMHDTIWAMADTQRKFGNRKDGDLIGIQGTRESL